MENKIIDLVRKIINKNIDDLTETTPIIDNGYIDSIGVMSLIDSIERCFSINISVEDMVIENFQSIKSIEGMLDRYLAQ